MTKGEMVTRLNKFMEDQGYMGIGTAYRIVNFLEDQGMAPPEVAEDVETGVCIMTPVGFQVHRTETSKVFVRKWENEA